MKRKLISVPLIPLAIAAVVAGALPRAVKRKMRPPLRENPHTPGYLGLPGRRVWLSGQREKKLHGWWIPVAHEAPAIVVMHGWGANASLMLPFARPLHAAGFHTFFVDARGHGHSEADDYASMPRFSEDLDVALDWVHASPRVTSAGVIGHSIGAGAAAMTTARRSDVAALVSVSAMADVWEVMTAHTSLSRMPAPAGWALRRSIEAVFGATFDEVAPEKVIPAIEVPTLIVHGERDEVVPLEHAFRLAEARGDAVLHLLPEAGHSDLGTFEAHIGPILGFLAQHLGGKPTGRVQPSLSQG